MDGNIFTSTSAGISLKRHPIVMRMEGLHPDQLSRYEMHRKRAGGDLEHVDMSRSRPRMLVGDEDWVEQMRLHIREMRQENFANELEQLQKRKRRKDLQQRLNEGPRDPWKASTHGPLREVILTAHHEWFDTASVFDGRSKRERERAFERCALGWLRENFGEALVHARADEDESAYHIHAVLMPIVEKGEGLAARRMIEPSSNPLINNYEAAQDSVGVHFAQIGLARGERRAEATRQARATGATLPERRTHVKTAQWRKEQDRAQSERAVQLERHEQATARRAEELRSGEASLATERAALANESAEVRERGAEARVIIAVAEAVEQGVLIEERGTLAPAKTSTPAQRAALGETLKRSPDAARRAVGIFTRALAGLRRQATVEAETKLARDRQEIEAADRAIIEIAKLVPASLRERIATARKSLARSITALSAYAERRGRGDREDH
ncbi:plasmid recombination protein [Sedimentimonas flavescens]|uniref:Plasmid recombination protein n=1 Tax=Sedimentimonas flavescens TaxID=2851012 RepID=A0ABT2ZZQ9_9RHOB|nr:plasmid recombination protein [Sedimentimonas flavescens]MCV2879062.1 plasmid recombination protein [Sedimentimonas flavescens]